MSSKHGPRAPRGGPAYTDETVAVARSGRDNRRGVRVKARQRSLWQNLRLALLILVAVMILGAGVLYWQISSLASRIVVSEVRPNPSLAGPLFGSNLLLIGVDERPDHPEEGVRSDTLILTRLNAPQGWVSLLAIPRDSEVNLLDIGPTKINVAYGQGYARAEELYGSGTAAPQGAMALSAQTVESFLQLPQRGMRVDHTAQINFAGFAGLIDALGGVTINVPTLIVDPEYPTEDFGVMYVEFQPGEQRMDGATALIYARTRHADSDFGRAQRQQQVLRALIDEFQAKNLVQQIFLLPSLLRAVAGEEGSSPAVLTTLPINRPDVLIGLFGLALGLQADAIGQFSINPQDVAVYENGSNLIWDAAGVQALLDRWQAPPNEVAEAARVQVFNGTAINGLAGRISAELEQTGFTLIVADTAPAGEYPRTIVYNLNNKPATSRRIAQQLGGVPVETVVPPGIVSEADIVVILGNDRGP
jgi:LCP family protein required for cell wall assembly